MKSLTYPSLSLMMFLQFFIWGSWFVTLGSYLNFNLSATGLQISNVFSTQSYGAIIAPFIIGLIADRYFNAEKILGALHLIGAVLMYLMYQSTDITLFFPYALVYMILYMPTLALVNTVSFRQIDNPEKQFAKIRIWGTIGWIVAGLAISYIFHWDADEQTKAGALRNTFLMASVASLVLGLFSFTLPKTPPTQDRSQKGSISEILGLNALSLLKDKNFLVFFISSILICIPLAFYYRNALPFLQNVGLANPTAKMAIGQMSEVLFLLLIPFFFSRYGVKKTILVGMFAWALRYVLFAYGDASSGTWMLIMGIALHGICYDFFFVAGQIYTDAKAGVKFKGAAQGLITLATYGIGMLIGYWVAGYVTDMYTSPEGLNWQSIWIAPAGLAFIIFLMFMLLFKDDKKVTV